MSLKKIIIGEPMPDKNDPKYKERYEREVEAGRKFAEKIKLPWLFGKIQLWANDNRKAFLVIVFGIVIGCFALNIFTPLELLQLIYRINPGMANLKSVGKGCAVYCTA